MTQEVLKLHLNPGTLERLRAHKEKTLIPTSAALRRLVEDFLNGTPTTPMPMAAGTSTSRSNPLTQRGATSEPIAAITVTPAPDQVGLASAYQLRISDSMVIELEAIGKAERKEAHEVFLALAMEGLSLRRGAALKMKKEIALVDPPAGADLDQMQREADEEEAAYSADFQKRLSDASARFEAENRTVTGRVSGTVQNAAAGPSTPERGYYDPVIVLDDAGVPVPDPFAHAGPDPHLVALAAERAAWDKLVRQ